MHIFHISVRVSTFTSLAFLQQLNNQCQAGMGKGGAGSSPRWLPTAVPPIRHRCVSSPPPRATRCSCAPQPRRAAWRSRSATSVAPLVVDRAKKLADSSYTPGQAAKLVSTDGSVEVQFPATAAKQKLKVRHARDPQRDAKPLPAAGTKRGVGVFALTATDEASTEVHQFDTPLTLTVHYTPEQLEALGIAEPDLTIPPNR